MLLTISTTHQPAADLGYLLHKHPQKLQRFDLAGGVAHVFYPQADNERCVAALLLDVDPIDLVRGKSSRTLDQYVNDRPYVASSLMAVAIAQVFGTALAGRCKERPELVTTPIPLTARIPAISCRMREGSAVFARLFEPLGYSVLATSHPLDEHFPDWGDSSVFSLELTATLTLSDLLSHLYVLIPVLDNDKHYFVGEEEVAKLLRHGEGWLASHPERELIAGRYLRNRRHLVDSALLALREHDGEGPEEVETDSPEDPCEEVGESRLSLHQQRHGVVLSVLKARGAKSVVDLGCGEGRLIRELLRQSGLERVVGMDVSHRSLEVAADRLRVDHLPPKVRERLTLLHGSLVYRDERLHGFDAAVLCEVIEHLDQPRLEAMERVVFQAARPGTVIITTPNREYNVMWETLAAGDLRHRDHRFEWTRAEFRAWAQQVAERWSYTCDFQGIGEPAVTPAGHDVGTPTQMGVFNRVD